ncbi:MAG: hypothetical protein ACRDPM_27600 [Solirubrobacteraceae bacterium]
MSPFTPAGEVARWRVIYQLLQRKSVGDVLTYEEMGDALELNPVEDRQTIQLSMRRAARELEVIDKHAVDVIAGEGYRIIEASEHLGLARRHQRKSSRALARGQSKVVNVNFNEVDAETRRALEVVAAAFALQMDFNARMDVRQKHLERAVASVTERVADHAGRTDEEISQLRERLRRLEEKTSGSG